jgi:glycogen debranching enzyme
VLQLDAVAGLGAELGHGVDRWIAERDTVLEALLDQLWTADGFVAVGVASGRTSPTTSLLTTLPIILADRLPPAVRDHLVTAVEQHLTKHGLATEPVDSPQYEDDGYWRGPIWAPSTALIEDGLRHAGAVELADIVSARFRELCERSGFAENFNARTGDGLRDRAYTWTAAVYLTLAAQHVRRSR